ncbi:hypothetical protein [uncultured Mucilaginibacter sp.]|uniref:hypothetical protein n=1 Tax=uncultured Mucilaginibacter sp. TaxID=797541 RepID=UPI0025D49920|nr:hypothetical protein [uncultured Mucilaginibacter sp.]
MINQTDLHRMRQDVGGTTAGYLVHQLLRLERDDITMLKHKGGMQFIDLNSADNGYDGDIIRNSFAFWTWWCKVWYMIDMKLIDGKVSRESYVAEHTIIQNHRIIESFKQQYQAFLLDGVEKMKKGGYDE